MTDADQPLGAYDTAESCPCQGCVGFQPCCDRETIHRDCGRCANHCWCVLCACGVLLVRHLDQARGQCAACFAASAAEVTHGR